jgi:phosphate transport system substrate-binding protein
MSLNMPRFFMLCFVAILTLYSGNLFADTIELEKNKKIEGELYVIRDGFHYFKIHRSQADRVRYASKTVKTDTIVMKDGFILKCKITAFVDDYYYVGVPSKEVKGISNTRKDLSPMTAKHEKRATSIPHSKEGTILRIHGSNTIGAKLGPAFASGYLKKLGATRLVEVTERDDEVAVRGYFEGSNNPAVIQIHSHGSSTAFADLEKNSCDIGAASRRISSKEVEKLAALGDMTGSASEHVIALDGIAVIVHKSNPIFKMTKDDIKKIFSGEIRDWSRIGGKPGKINVYARDDKSGTWDTFKSLVLGNDVLTPSAKRYEDSGALSNEVASDINGIGFIGLPYVLNAKALAVSDGAEPIVPDRSTIATEDYPLSRRLFFYAPENSKNAYVKSFIEFTLSEEGQAVVDEIGFVDLNIRLTRPDKSPDFSAQYKKLTEMANRISLNFRFRKNSFELDNKGVRDLSRIVKYLKSQTSKGRKVILFGFADSMGSPADNKLLSEKRAQAVRKELLAKGISISVPDAVGFGMLNPVAANDTEDGRSKNRRVEIWIK